MGPLPRPGIDERFCDADDQHAVRCRFECIGSCANGSAICSGSDTFFSGQHFVLRRCDQQCARRYVLTALRHELTPCPQWTYAGCWCFDHSGVESTLFRPVLTVIPQDCGLHGSLGAVVYALSCSLGAAVCTPGISGVCSHLWEIPHRNTGDHHQRVAAHCVHGLPICVCQYQHFAVGDIRAMDIIASWCPHCQC